jgi:hypothetical protein
MKVREVINRAALSKWLSNKIEFIVLVGWKESVFMKRRVVYTANGVSTFNPATFMLTQSGINLINPGPYQRESAAKFSNRQQFRNVLYSVRSDGEVGRLQGSRGRLQDKFFITHINVRSILPHIDELRLIFKDNSPAVIAITETWLDDSVADSEVEIYGYSLHRLDRCNKRGGGVALYLSNNLKYIRKSELEEGPEALWMQVELNNIRYLIGCVYRAPDESLEVFDYMDDVLRYATRNNLEVIILGDVNCDYLNASLKQSVRLNEFILENDLEQLIKEPTRVKRVTRNP